MNFNADSHPISVEVVPGKPPLDFNALKTLSACRSVSVTWHQSAGANIDSADAILLAGKLRCLGYNVLSHLAGRKLWQEDVLKILDKLKELGVENILAVQGDKSNQTVEAHKDNIKYPFPHAVDLVRFIRKVSEKYFKIGVTGYPEKHPESTNLEEDLKYLKEKVDAGADFILTQAVFKYPILQDYMAACRRKSIKVPIIPGVFVFSSSNQLQAMAALTSLKVPHDIAKTVSSISDNDVALRNFSVHTAANLIAEILNDRNGSAAKRVHLFSMNNLDLIKRVYERLGFGGSPMGQYLGPLRSAD